MTTSHRLGDLQHAILAVLWQRGEASVAEVHQELEEERGLALTTIATMLTKMEAKGIVRHRTEGRRFIYRPKVSETAVRRSMVSELTDRFFAGDAAALVNHLLSEYEIDASELAALKAAIAEKEEEG